MRRLHKWVRGLAIALGAVVGSISVIVVAVVILVLYTPWGTQLVLERVRTFYDERVAARVEVEAIEGSIARGLVLRGVHVIDSSGLTLVEAEQVALTLAIAPLFRGAVSVRDASIVGAIVSLPRDGSPGFADLAFPDDGEAPEPDDGVMGPDLPLALHVELELLGVRVDVVEVAGRRTWAHGVDASIEAEGQGTTATLELETHATLPAGGLIANLDGDLEVDELFARMHWNSPALAVDLLALQSNAGHLRLRDGWLEADRLRGGAGLEARIERAWLSQFVEEQTLPEELGVVLDVTGTRQRIDADGLLDFGGEGYVGLFVGGEFSPTYDVLIDLAGEVVPRRWLPRSTDAPLALTARATLRGSVNALTVTLRSACGDCVGHSLRVTADGTLDLDGRGGELGAHLVYADAEIDAHAHVTRSELQSATWKVVVPSVRPLTALAGWFAEVPAIAGALTSDGVCRREDTLRCGGALQLQGLGVASAKLNTKRITAAAELELGADGEPSLHANVDINGLRWDDKFIKTAKVAFDGTKRAFAVQLEAVGPNEEYGKAATKVTIDPGRTIVDLERLRFRMGELNVRLHDPARIVVAGKRVAIDRLALDLDEGRIIVAGRMAPTGNDLRVKLEDVDLSILNWWAPAAYLQGSVDLDARLSGTMKTPTLKANLAISRLARGTQPLARKIDVELAYQRERATLSGSLRGIAIKSIEFSAHAPLVVDLETPRFALLEDQAIAAHVEVEGTRFTLMRNGELQKIEGVAAATADVAGTWRDPTAKLVATLERGVFRGGTLGDIKVEAKYAEGQARVDIAGDVRRNAWLRASATVPMEIDPTRRHFAWLADSPHMLDVQVQGLDLVDAASWARIAGPSGKATVHVHAEGPVDDLVTALELRLHDAALFEAQLGEVMARVDVARDARATLETRGGFADVDIQTHLPVRFDREGMHWDDTQQLAFDAKLAQVSLEQVAALIPGRVPMRGQGAASLKVGGTRADPTMDAEVRIDDFRWEQSVVTDVRVNAGHREQRIEVVARVGKTGHQALELQADVPLGVDLTTLSTNWRRHARHELAVNFIGLDETLLLAAIPEAAMALRLDGQIAGSGTLKQFEMGGKITGFVHQRRSGRSDVALTLYLSENEQVLHLEAGPQGPLQLDAHATAKADIGAIVGGRAQAKDVRVSSHVLVKRLALDMLQGLLPEQVHDPRGTLTAELRTSGPLTAAKFSGNVQLDEGELTVVPMRQRLRDIEIDMQFDQRRVDLRKLRVESGKGYAQASAHLDLMKAGMKGEAKLRVKDLPIVRPGLPYIKIDANVQSKFTSSAGATRVGVTIDDTVVEVLGTNVPAPKSIPENRNIEVASLTQPKTKAKCAELEAARAGQGAPTSGKQARLNLDVRIGKPIIIAGPQIELRWDGALTVRGTSAHREVSGAFESKGGWIRFLGSKFDVVEGSVTMPAEGDLDPYLRVLATTQTAEAQVAILIQGRASAPQLVLSSDPPMEEFRILSLLVTGSSEARDASDENVEAEAAALLATFQNPALQRALNRAFGIDRAAVTFGESVNQPIVTLGKRVTRDIYVESQYHYNAPEDENEAQLNVEYRFAPHWMVETFFGDAAAGGLDVFWFKRFGGPKKAKSPTGAITASEQRAKARERARMQQLREDCEPATP